VTILNAPRQEVRIFNPSTTLDVYGNQVSGLDLQEPSLITRGWLQMDPSSESTSADRHLLKNYFSLFIFEPVAITAQSKVEVGGNLYSVDGNPYTPSFPSGFKYMKVSLVLVSG
jgi:hypothetical protein